ncbi:spermidine/putrescine ABC transporter substrate-binding protein, partial [Vibrio agarivorans]
IANNEYILDYVKFPTILASIDIAFGYSGDSYILNKTEKKRSWAYSIPTEGTTIWVECLAAINHGPMSDETIETLLFLSQVDIAAQNAMDSWFATPSKKAKSFTSDEYRLDEELFPPQDVLDRSYLYQPLDMKSLQIRSRIIKDLIN